MVFMQGLWGEAEWNKEPDGAAAQEVYNTAKNVYLIIKQAVTRSWQCGQNQRGTLKMKTNVLEGENRNTRSAPPALRALTSLVFTGRRSQRIQNCSFLSAQPSIVADSVILMLYDCNYSPVRM